MSFPTPLSPWFVVQRLRDDGKVEYFKAAVDEDPRTFTLMKAFATIFPSIHTADKIAHAEDAEIRALTSKNHMKEFGRA